MRLPRNKSCFLKNMSHISGSNNASKISVQRILLYSTGRKHYFFSWDHDLVVVERLVSSNDPQSYDVWSLVLLLGPPMAYRSELRSLTNSDPATTAKQATYCPMAVKADDGCSRTAPSRCGLSCHRGTDVLSSLCGHC